MKYRVHKVLRPRFLSKKKQNKNKTIPLHSILKRRLFCRIPVILEAADLLGGGRGGGGAHPLHPPPRSVPAV